MCRCVAAVRVVTALALDTYRAYPFLLRLHALRELECAVQLVGCTREDRAAMVAEWNWDERLDLTTPSFRLREPVLALRRCILRIFDMRSQEADMWLKVGSCAHAALRRSRLTGSSMRCPSPDCESCAERSALSNRLQCLAPRFEARVHGRAD